MKKKLYEIWQKNKPSILIALIIVVIGSIGLLLFLNIWDHSSIKTFKNNNYSIKYDNSFRITTQKEHSISLKHRRNGTINIEVVSLEENYKYASMEDILDKLLYDIEKQNTKYKLLAKERDTVTKNQYDGYKMLYENGANQVMVVATKKSDKLILFTYEAKNDYFDIVLDSVQNIIYEFDTIEEKYNLNAKIELKTSNINYTKEEKIALQLKGSSEYEIASHNYYVKYTIPSQFKIFSFDSQTNRFHYDQSLLKDAGITLNTKIINRNIYEYLDKDQSLNVFSQYKTYRESEDYSKFKEDISKLDSKEYDAYIYKNSYYDNKDLNKEVKNSIRENIVLMYALNQNHVFVIEISSSHVGIPKELIDKIKIHSSQNYSSFVKIDRADHYLLATLKRFTDYKKNKVEEIHLKIPEKYEEVEKENNIYSKRYFSLNYNEEKEMYQYDIEYEVSYTTEIDSSIDIINRSFSKSYGAYNYLTPSGVITCNGKNFQSYDGGYTNLGGVLFTSTNRFKYYIYKKVLFYELENGGYLIITISGNGNQISNELIKEVTNFDVEVKDF